MIHEDLLTLETAAIAMELQTSGDLRALRLENRLKGIELSMAGGNEFEVITDSSDGRVGITGWRGLRSSDVLIHPDLEPGYCAGYARRDFDDSGWPGLMTTVGEGPWRPEQTFWARTRIFLPLDREKSDLTLVLGGCGLFDFDCMRVFVNGTEVATREESKRWREPGKFRFPVGNSLRDVWTFGAENVIAVQQSGFRGRSAELDAIDPDRTRNLPLKCQWPVPWEQYLVFGQPSRTELFTIEQVERNSSGCRVLARSERITATIEYFVEEAVISKKIELQNTGSEVVRILHVGLGSYFTKIETSDGEQGFPVYVGDDWFFGIAHPSGFAIGQDGNVVLRQHPGVDLAPGATWKSMEAVIGAAGNGGARAAFHRYLTPRIRRVRRDHAKPLAIIEPFGAKRDGTAEEYERFWQFGYFDETQEFLFEHLDKVEAMQKQTGCKFDAYFVDFWNSYDGDLRDPDPVRFPNGFQPVLDRIRELGMEPALWIDSTWERWSIGGNPAVDGCHTHDPQFGTDRDTLCRATQPYRAIFTDAFVHHVKENGIRYLKFDNLQACCFNPSHSHLTGRHATEAIQSAVIETLTAIDAACPKVFMMLYWGHRSPWWLLHADTLFEPGLLIEAAHAGASPTLYARDSVTVGLDQAHWHCRDIPKLGKDSLGVWMSHWKWNSRLGTERWAESTVMDMCRGHLMIQPWSDPDFLDDAGRATLALLIQLLQTIPECFANSTWILGNPWKNEPYGYRCSNGTRTILAINNCCWDVAVVNWESLDLGMDSIGGVVRWFPEPELWPAPKPNHSFTMAPFEVLLLEVFPEGSGPALPMGLALGQWPKHEKVIVESLPIEVKEISRILAPKGSFPRPPAALPPVPEDAEYEKRGFSLHALPGPGLLFVSVEIRRNGMILALENAGEHFCINVPNAVPVQANEAFSTPWQAWRIPQDTSKPFEARVVAFLPAGTECIFSAKILSPRSEACIPEVA